MPLTINKLYPGVLSDEFSRICLFLQRNIGVNVSNFSRNAISIVVFQLNLYNHFSPKRDILFNGIRYLFQRLNIFHTSCFYYMEIKGII